MTKRFTIDGSPQLEQRLDCLCREIGDRVEQIVPARMLEGLVLGGGYGRGEGGVLKTQQSDEPYNDLEFYVFLRGNRLLNQWRYANTLNDLGSQMSPSAGLHIEFKCDSIQTLKASAVSMFTYDLVAGHCVVRGESDIFADCQHHLNASAIPLSEATRLLFNRCSGLLLVREKLSRSANRSPSNQKISEEDADFIGRNLAKAQLALGDAVLAASGNYHWSCRERHRRLNQLSLREPPPQFAEIKRHHALGVEFKLHPRRAFGTLVEFGAIHNELSRLSSELWLWLESIRLQEPFFTVREYALARSIKCADSAPWRNLLLNMKTFGLTVLNDALAWRYPRERLFNVLPLLLWETDAATQPNLRRLIQKQLHTRASDWGGWVNAYKNVWPGYG